MDAREAALKIFHSALQAADPVQAALRVLRRYGDRLAAGPQRYSLHHYRRVIVVGFGKAAASMAQGIEQILGDVISDGLVIVKYGHTAPLKSIRLREAGHPLLDENSLAGTSALLDLLDSASPEDLVICLVSGGGSALLELPAEGISLMDLRAANDALLRSGASITEMNTVRKHLSQVKGGQLARRTRGAQVLTLVLSDIIGSPLDMIASGPTTPDPTTFQDALGVIEHFRLAAKIPQPVLLHLQAGVAGGVPETPKPGDIVFAKVQNLVIADNSIACQAAGCAAQDLGWRPLLLTTSLQGEAREAGRVLAAIAREIQASGNPVKPPACLILGGETTVTVRGRGKGGRSQELALAAAIELAGRENITILSAGTDGTDGPTDAAGAIVDGSTLLRAQAAGLAAAGSLVENDSYHFFQALGDLVITGPTRTNVNDIVLLLVDRKV